MRCPIGVAGLFRVFSMVSLFSAVGLLGTATPARAVDTASIVQSAWSQDCLQYRVVGVCLWLRCTPFGCSVRSSVKVGHYIPELVVSSYQNTGKNPWRDVAFMSPSNGNARGGGVTAEGADAASSTGEDGIHNSLRFKNGDAIGHPAATLFSQFAGQWGYTCSTPARPLQPYFLSVLDTYAWREGLPEKVYPQALTPGLREVRQGLLNRWGNVYPRAGFVTQSNDYKAAAVVAQRVADLVTRNGQPHVYTPLVPRTRSSRGVWAPPPVKEGDKDTHKWQRLTPAMTRSCAVFPDRGPAASFRGHLAQQGDYAWALWRPYSCCKKRGQKLLSHTGDYP